MISVKRLRTHADLAPRSARAMCQLVLHYLSLLLSAHGVSKVVSVLLCRVAASSSRALQSSGCASCRVPSQLGQIELVIRLGARSAV